MEPDGVERRLAAILAADVVEYTRLMEADEAGTLAALKAHRRELVDPKISEHGGRVVKLMGDGALVEFASVVDALQCAMEIQRGMAERNAEVPQGRRIRFRVGINLGDVIIDGDDIYGEGVNIAARLEKLAEAGGICVSGKVYDEIKNKLPVGYRDLGDREMKNVSEAVRVYGVLLDPKAAGKLVRTPDHGKWRRPALAAAAAAVLAVGGVALWNVYLRPAELKDTVACDAKAVPALPDKPSIAVLPFDNLSGDPGQDYLADGVAEDIITTLANVSDVFVISRRSSFTYKDRTAKVQDVARDLGVGYVLEGSVQQSGDSLRVSARLVDGKAGSYLWAERFDRGTEDIFAVKDEITLKILTALKVELTEGEMARIWAGGTSSLKAYQLFWQSVEELQRFNKDANEKARVLAHKVTELDPNYSGGWLMLGWTHLQDIVYGSDASKSIRLGTEFANKAYELDDANPNVYALLGMVSLHKGDPEKAVELARKGLALGPNQADVHGLLGLYLNAAGRPEEAIPPIKKAMRLSPYYPTFYLIQLGRAYRMTGRYREAIVEYKKLACRLPDSLYAYLGQALSYGRLGRDEEARAAVAKLLTIEPSYSLTVHQGTTAAKGTDLARDLDVLRRAGLPE